MVAKRIDPKVGEEIISLYREGKTYKQISEILGVSIWYISKTITKNIPKNFRNKIKQENCSNLYEDLISIITKIFREELDKKVNESIDLNLPKNFREDFREEETQSTNNKNEDCITKNFRQNEKPLLLYNNNIEEINNIFSKENIDTFKGFNSYEKDFYFTYCLLTLNYPKNEDLELIREIFAFCTPSQAKSILITLLAKNPFLDLNYLKKVVSCLKLKHKPQKKEVKVKFQGSKKEGVSIKTFKELKEEKN